MYNNLGTHRKTRRGAALIFVMVAIVLLGMFASTAASGLFRERREMERALHKTQCEILAEDAKRRAEPGVLIVDRDLLRTPRDVRIETEREGGVRVSFDPSDPPYSLRVEK